MTDKELLEAIGQMMDAKLTPINEHLETMDQRLETMDRRLIRVEATLDHEIKPAIRLLAEGHENILEHIDEKIADRTDKLEWRLEALETIVRQHLREAKQA